MSVGMSEEEVWNRVSEYKRTPEMEESVETVNLISEAARSLAEALVDHYDDKLGTDEAFYCVSAGCPGNPGMWDTPK